MKSIILTILVLSFNITANSQVENIIYEKIIDEYVLKLRPPNIDYSLKTTLTVLEKPVYMDTLNIDDYKRFKAKYEKLDRQTFLDFINKAQEDVQFEGISIPNFEIVTLKRDSIPKHKELILKYPYWIHSILEFSNIGFNEEKDQALIYYGFNSGSGVGGGVYIVFEKKKKKWKEKAVIPAWAA
jgi:hypothetical protein